MRRIVVIFAAAWFLIMGMGLAEHVHNVEHAREDARQRQELPDQDPTPVHDESNCEVHALLHAPLVAPAVGVPLIVPRVFVAFVMEFARSPATVRVPSRIDCRGPPIAC